MILYINLFSLPLLIPYAISIILLLIFILLSCQGTIGFGSLEITSEITKI